MWKHQKLKVYAMYNPKSVVDAMLSGMFDNYWNQTETYEALKGIYYVLNFDGLKRFCYKNTWQVIGYRSIQVRFQMI